MMRVSAVIFTSALLAAFLAPLPAEAQFGVPRSNARPASPGGESLSLYAYTLDHQKAAEAVALVQPLLSSRGTVELRQSDNTIVVRDSLSSLTRIIPVLHRFDHPPRELELEMLVVQAYRTAYSPALPSPDVPAHLLRHFHKLLPYSTYQVLARTEIRPQEGEDVMYEMGAGFGVSFRLGTVLENRTLKLHDFRIARAKSGEARRQLLRSTLMLRLGQPLALALAKEESSETALMVVLTSNLKDSRQPPVKRSDTPVAGKSRPPLPRDR